MKLYINCSQRTRDRSDFENLQHESRLHAFRANVAENETKNLLEIFTYICIKFLDKFFNSLFTF